MSDDELSYKEVLKDFNATADRKRWGKRTKKQYKRILQKITQTNIGLKKEYTEKEINRLLAQIRNNTKKSELKDSYEYFIHTTVRTIVKNVLFANWPLNDLPKIRNGNKEKKTFSKERIENYISRAKELEKVKVLDLVISTTYGVRRVELCKITKDDIGEDSIFIETGKGGEARTHYIPEQVREYVRPEFAREREYEESSLSKKFKRLEKDMGFEHRKGYSWHSVRRRLSTELRKKQREGVLDREDIFSFFRWSEGDDILDEYTVFDKEEVEKSQEQIDKRVFQVHPFLDCWKV